MILRGHASVEEETGTSSHGGSGRFSVRTLLKDEFDSNIAYVRELVLSPRSSIGVHEHVGDEEIYYVVSGRGVMTVDEAKEKVTAGDVVLTKSGSKHGLINEGMDALKIFVVSATV